MCCVCKCAIECVSVLACVRACVYGRVYTSVLVVLLLWLSICRRERGFGASRRRPRAHVIGDGGLAKSVFCALGMLWVLLKLAWGAACTVEEALDGSLGALGTDRHT